MNKPNDLPRFTTILAALCETFQKTPTNATYLGYEMALDDLPIDRIEVAARKAMRSCKFMPSGSELRELAGELSATDRPRLAWGEFEAAVVRVGGYKSPTFADPLINAVVRHLGGWIRVCELPAEEFDKWLRKDFEAAYATFMRAPPSAEACGPLVGISETHNRVHAPSHPVPAVAIETSLPSLLGLPGVDRCIDVVMPEPAGTPKVEFKRA